MVSTNFTISCFVLKEGYFCVHTWMGFSVCFPLIFLDRLFPCQLFLLGSVFQVKRFLLI